MNKKEIRVALIGAGRIGKLHGDNILAQFPGVKLAGVASVPMEAALEWTRQKGIERVTEDYRELVNDPEIDAVLICSSTDTHAEIIIEAAKAGKHIFCEKPIASSVPRIVEALEAANKAGVKLQVGFNRRFDPHFAKAQEMVKDGKIGDLHLLRITSRDPEAPPVEYVKVSGGMFLDMTIHDFDMARFLSGSEVEEVYASGAVLVDPAIGEAGDIDTAVIQLKFANGAIGTIDNSRRAAYGYDQRIEAFGSKGQVAVANVPESNAVLSNGEAVVGEKPQYFFLERYQQSFIRELRDFFEAIEKDTPTPVTGQDGLEPVLIGLAAALSVKENRPVKLDEIRQQFGL
ncbi:inositol 2-dehydrogenase [Anoxynatronum buryatiense]|uniref:Myo-inositol 2-dehydrogenase n=1 Tax=Anoxynatronum buryatiense TaxID=489973 RepID=A0AA46AHR7_9CLOT|nr:inositol 2-dehydrogenase [Anoxynatronum buryatiense]SMP41888.1 myo-inositol 2-dehydrogenase [Anoxynatronum buryatiense]